MKKQQIRNNIQETSDHLALAQAFLKKYGEALGADDRAFMDHHNVILYDAALAGEVLGKDGWIREVRFSEINWVRDIDGMHVMIQHAENNNMHDTPVPPHAFPLQLKNIEA